MFKVPTRTEKLGEKREGISSYGILNKLEMPGEITQNTGKVRGFHTNVISYCFVMSLIVYYLLKWNKFSVKKNMEKILENEK